MLALLLSPSAPAAEPPVPPETLAELSTAIAPVVARGLPDLHGAEYREIDLVVRTLRTPGERTVHTAGFVRDDETRAVAWNGLEYPIAHLGPPRSLVADVAGVLAQESAEESAWALFVGSHYRRWREDYPEEALDVDTHTVGPMKVAVLLRAGEPELAVAVRAAWEAGAPEEPLGPALERAWGRTLYDRVVTGHRLGRPLAEDLARLEAAYPDVTTDPLVVDAHRRLGRPPSPSLDELAAIPNLQTRMRARVAALDEVTGPDDPALTALAREGDFAVPWLIEVLAHDTRLTREVTPWRISDQRTPHPVRGVAWRLVRDRVGAELLRVFPEEGEGRGCVVGVLDDETPRVDWDEAAERLRGWWAHSRRRWRPDRSVAILADPRARDLWVAAARDLAADRANGAYPVRKSAEPLIQKRAEDLATADPTNIASCDLVRTLPLGETTLPALRAELPRAWRRLQASEDHYGFEADATQCVVDLTLALAEAGERAPLVEYAAWLSTVSAKRIGRGLEAGVEPLWRLPDAPELRGLREVLFGQPWTKGWGPWFGEAGDPSVYDLPGLRDALATGLVDVPPFRDHVLAALREERSLGYVAILHPGDASFGDNNWWFDPADPRAAAPGSVSRMRVQDLVAAYVARGWEAREPEAPTFSVGWGPQARDAAIAAMMERLERGH